MLMMSSVLQVIISKNQSKCENNSALYLKLHTNAENVLLITENLGETVLRILNPNSCYDMDLMCELIWSMWDFTKTDLFDINW